MQEKPVKEFSHVQLKAATCDFRIIGSGGFGVVYDGATEDGLHIAVKMLHKVQGAC